MTDSHTHLTFPQIKINLEQILDEFVQKGGTHLLNVGHTPKTNIEVFGMYHSLSERYNGMIRNAVGIHPEYISEILSNDLEKYRQIAKEIDSFKTLVEKNIGLISAIGECGLDYYHLKQDQSIKLDSRREIIEQQRNLFKAHLELSLKHKLPLTIHTRDIQGENQCIEDALGLVTGIGKGKIKGAFHSYTQDKKYIKEILGIGFMIGVNGIVTYPKAENVREIVSEVPLEKLLLETDAPLLPPQQIRRNKKYWRNYGAPADIYEIAQMVAQVKGANVEEVIRVTTENFKSLFLLN